MDTKAPAASVFLAAGGMVQQGGQGSTRAPSHMSGYQTNRWQD